MSRIVTKADLARLLDLSRSTISAYLRRGMPETSDGRLDEAQCRAWIRANVRVQSGMRGHGGRIAAGEVDTAPDGPTLADAKRVKATFEAMLAEHRRDKLLNALMPTDDVVAGVAAEHAEVKARLRQVPAWVAPKLTTVDAAPLAAALLQKVFCGALNDLSTDTVWDGNLEDAPLPDAATAVYYISSDGEVHYSRRHLKAEPPLADSKKPKRRRRSSPAIEAAIAEADAEPEVDNDLVVAVERAIPTMTLTDARTRKEIAEGEIKEAEYALLRKAVVRTEPVFDALTANLVGVKSKILGAATKVAPRIAFLTDVKEIEKIISIEIEEILEDLTNPKLLVGKCI